MTQVNDPSKDSDENQDTFRTRNGQEVEENDIEMNGFRESDNTSSDDEDVDDDEPLVNGYQLLPQELPSEIHERENTNFADFDANFQSSQNNTIVSSNPSQLPSNPSVQAMVHQALREHKQEEIQEEEAIFSSSTSSTKDHRENDTICLDEQKVEVIKASMSRVKLQSPPNWLSEMTEEEWNKMLKQKLKRDPC